MAGKCCVNSFYLAFIQITNIPTQSERAYRTRGCHVNVSIKNYIALAVQLPLYAHNARKVLMGMRNGCDDNDFAVLVIDMLAYYNGRPYFLQFAANADAELTAEDLPALRLCVFSDD